MEVVDIMAEEEGVASEGGSVVKVTPATSVGGPATGLSIAKDKVMQQYTYTDTEYL